MQVSHLGLGTMTFGAETDEAGSHAQLDAFVAAGGTLIDTADVYSRGVSESIIGRWITARGGADDVVVATKGRFPMTDDGRSEGTSRRWLSRAIRDSLRRLQVDHVDLYQVHGWDPHVPVLETLKVLDDMVRDGLTRYVGWSNVSGWQLQRIVRLAEQHGLARTVTLQPQYNLLARELELELLPQCVEEEIGVLPWSPLGGGWLTGKYRRDEFPTGATRLGEDPNRGVEAWERRNTERTWALLDVVGEVAEEVGRSMAQVSLAWVAQRPAVASVLLGARTTDHLADNLGAADLVLDDSQMDRLTVASATGIPDYPYRMLEQACGLRWWQELGLSTEA